MKSWEILKRVEEGEKFIHESGTPLSKNDILEHLPEHSLIYDLIDKPETFKPDPDKVTLKRYTYRTKATGLIEQTHWQECEWHHDNFCDLLDTEEKEIEF